MSSRCRGLTLVEVLAALMLMSMLTAFLLPALVRSERTLAAQAEVSLGLEATGLIDAHAEQLEALALEQLPTSGTLLDETGELSVIAFQVFTQEARPGLLWVTYEVGSSSMLRIVWRQQDAAAE